MHIALKQPNGYWELREVMAGSTVGTDGRILTDAQAALPWPNVTTDDNGATWRAMTDAEKTALANAPLKAALLAQLQGLLSTTDYHVLPDSPHPADMPTWTAFRAQARAAITALNAGAAPATVTIPPLPAFASVDRSGQ